jgi:hypothetical protein
LVIRLAALLGAGSGASPALAQAGGGTPAVAARHYDIPAGPLAAVLTRLATEAGIYLAGPAQLAQGKNSPGLKGDYSVQGALNALLRDTGLEAVPDGN